MLQGSPHSRSASESRSLALLSIDVAIKVSYVVDLHLLHSKTQKIRVKKVISTVNVTSLCWRGDTLFERREAYQP
jgi:hypothetical protein